MNEATKSDRGVSTTTTAAIMGFIVSMNTMVQMMVIIPEKNWVNPRRRPSANWSTSDITQLTVSP